MTLDRLNFCKNILKTFLSFKMRFQNTNFYFFFIDFVSAIRWKLLGNKTLPLEET